MFIALILIAETAGAWRTPGVLHRSSQMMLELVPGVKTEQTCQAHEFMTDAVVVLEMILQTPLILEGAETEVAIYLVIPCVVDMVLQSISIFENALAEVAIVLVVQRLLDVIEKRRLVGELQGADAAPVLVRVIRLFAALRG
jgi:hypothetical protein